MVYVLSLLTDIDLHPFPLSDAWGAKSGTRFRLFFGIHIVRAMGTGRVGFVGVELLRGCFENPRGCLRSYLCKNEPG